MIEQDSPYLEAIATLSAHDPEMGAVIAEIVSMLVRTVLLILTEVSGKQNMIIR